MEKFVLVTTLHVLNITILNTSSLPDKRTDRGVCNVRVHAGIINSASCSASRNDSDLNAVGNLYGGENLKRLKSKLEDPYHRTAGVAIAAVKRRKKFALEALS